MPIWSQISFISVDLKVDNKCKVLVFDVKRSEEVLKQEELNKDVRFAGFTQGCKSLYVLEESGNLVHFRRK